jgi:hypothetical protein
MRKNNNLNFIEIAQEINDREVEKFAKIKNWVQYELVQAFYS